MRLILETWRYLYFLSFPDYYDRDYYDRDYYREYEDYYRRQDRYNRGYYEEMQSYTQHAQQQGDK